MNLTLSCNPELRQESPKGLPHRSHQSAITAALDATNGNVRKVQSLNLYVNFETLMIYDDNRGKSQL
ncbi:hypothetical protein [Coleofasciculus sp. FACHB-SPT36]|uniref:hypothetical protein n=1 Tax=Cyanophyceae TaxID=3028117 RepID=UPI00168A84AE|nr:hypothetical protein [Coleofasciculus sp. FACHB-SPT36]MBD2538648.1 hypothetical protein [Coleofasciculus sp. FACHB-SPT36]